MNPPALYARNHKPAVRDKIDFDYIEKLHPTDIVYRNPRTGVELTGKEYLAVFADEGLASTYGGILVTDPDMQAAVNRQRTAARRDAWYRIEKLPINPIDENEGDSLDGTPTPAYLNSHEYKEVVAEIRELLRSTPRSRAERRLIKGKETARAQALAKAQARLKQIANGGQ